MEGSIMRQVRHWSATYYYPAGDLHCKFAERARTPSEQQYSDPLPGRALRSNVPEGQASLSALSKELSINPKTVAKWRKRATVEDMKMDLSRFDAACLMSDPAFVRNKSQSSTF